MSRLLLDTCSWIWLASDRRRLSRPAAAAIGEARERRQVYLSVLSCWEVAKLVEKGRLTFAIPAREWIARALRLSGLTVCPLTPEIAVDSTELPGLFHGDPADQVIVATARSLGAPVVTPDAKIRRYPHVRTLW